MKNLFAFLVIISMGISAYSQVTHSTATSVGVNNKPTTQGVAHPPFYPQGDKALIDFVMRHIEIRPEMLKETNGIFKAKLAINEKGLVKDVDVVKSTSKKEVDDEVVRVLKMTKWKPAENEKGKPVANFKTVSITFGRSNKKSGCKGNKVKVNKNKK